MEITTVVVPDPEPTPEPEPAPTVVVVEAPPPPVVANPSADILAASLADRLILLEQRITDVEAELFGNRREMLPGDEEPEPVPPAVEGETIVEPAKEIEERKEKPGKLGGGWLI